MNKLTEEKIEKMLEGDEGFSARVYKDTLDIDSCGDGYNLEANPSHLSATEIADIYANGITRERARELLEEEVEKTIKHLVADLPYFDSLPENAQIVFVDMAYNMGVKGVERFKTMLADAENGDFVKAAHDGLNSKWARQIHGRATRLMTLLAQA